MTASTKIDFRYRRAGQLDDITDLVEMLFPGNRNQQHAAARVLLELKTSQEPVASLSHLEREHGISRRTLQRSRAKLARLGLIERVTWMNSRYGGQQGWKLSSRMSTALRRLADWVDEWRKDTRPERMEKDEALVGVLG
jgi:DNA-binding HxlR family transcriptional regulator